MSYQVIARKYRPQTFDEVVGQEVVTTTLRNAISNERVAHAFLFSGVRGVGKTTMARILAKALNCHEGIRVDPCGKCPSCIEVARSGSVDVQEIDAASNTGVDNIRELRASVNYATARDRFKIFIIDEVHMLSNAAFNALLKTLEEPPSHVKFVLATTEQHKIPVTITSRCQHFEFKPIPFASILKRLESICAAEEVQISDHSLRAIAAAGQGSMRDAQSALDQIISFGEKNIDDDTVRALLGAVDAELLQRILEAVLTKDSKALLERMREASDSGIEATVLCRELIQTVRDLMVVKVAGWNDQLLHLPDSRQDEMLRLAESVSRLQLLRLYDLLAAAAEEIKWSSQGIVHIEMMLMKMVAMAGLPEIEDVIASLHGAGNSSAGGSAKHKESALDDASARPQPVARQETPAPKGPRTSGGAQQALAVQEYEEDDPVPEAKETKVAEPVDAPAGISDGGEVARRILERVAAEAPSMDPWIQPPTRIRYQEGMLVLDVPGGETLRAKMLRESAEWLSKLAGSITGTKVRVDIRLGDQAQEVREKAQNPEDDPKVQAFLKTFPGKTIVERTTED